MRRQYTILLVLLAFPVFAQEWDDLLARANREHKPIVIFFRGDPCERCDEFERVAVHHPTIERRMPNVVFAIAPTTGSSYIGFFDRLGALRARWPFVPGTMNFGIILDSVIAVAPRFDCAVELLESSAPGNAELEVATGLARLGRIADARAALARAKAQGATMDVVPAAPKRRAAPQVIPMRALNEGGELFWLRFIAPVAGPADGNVRVSMNVRTPAAHRVERVTVSWNDAERAVLTEPPWETRIRIPPSQVGVLRAVLELDDGRTSEDAVLLNASGAAGEANVQLVELPVTILNHRGPIAPPDILVSEGRQWRPVEAIATADETPLTVGLLIDVSDSMYKTLPDLQEAAIRFLQALLGKRDRAFLITFDSEARLVQPATSDVGLLEKEIMRIRPYGLTALHDATAIGLMQFEGVKGRRALIVFTDGLDRTSHYRASEVAELARRVNVPIHVIESMPVQLPDGALLRVARATGGTANVLTRLDELPGVYARIEAALRAQILAFIRTDPATRENEWRPMRVEVKGSEVYAPEGYYATW